MSDKPNFENMVDHTLDGPTRVRSTYPPAGRILITAETDENVVLITVPINDGLRMWADRQSTGSMYVKNLYYTGSPWEPIKHELAKAVKGTLAHDFKVGDRCRLTTGQVNRDLIMTHEKWAYVTPDMQGHPPLRVLLSELRPPLDLDSDEQT